jgi:hypothetical protein
MLGEFDIFNRYADIMGMPGAVNWVKSPETVQLLIANNQLGQIRPTGIQADKFYEILNDPAT